MSCPYAHPVRGNGHCNGRGIVAQRNQWIPCPSCWAATGRQALSGRQTVALRLYHVLLLELGATGTDQPDRLAGLGRQLDDAAAQLRERGVGDAVRDGWVRWVETHLGADGLEQLVAGMVAAADRKDVA